MNPSRILCIGKDAGLLRSRRAVLAHGGYDAHDTLFYRANDLLQRERFDLIILSVHLTDSERQDIREMAGASTPILNLRKLVPPSALLQIVEESLKPRNRSAKTKGSVQPAEPTLRTEHHLAPQISGYSLSWTDLR